MKFRFIIVFLSTSLYAEYRVYLLDLDLGNDKHITIVSTLDHVQFPEWYYGMHVKKVEYLDSWMCFGDSSGYKEHCPNPIQKVKINEPEICEHCKKIIKPPHTAIIRNDKLYHYTNGEGNAFQECRNACKRDYLPKEVK